MRFILKRTGREDVYIVARDKYDAADQVFTLVRNMRYDEVAELTEVDVAKQGS